ncbi:hypothetical protein LCGC14_1119480 [marine sediment metagenome]|uniref:Uncharacterized protein n=1 Tax=marine sediment metagenome TaxID=412755 RepID=A0A0F9M4I1_9ZZZZ
MKKRIIFTISLLIMLLSLVALPALASSPTALTAEGDSPREARIIVDVPEGTTLGQIESIAWEEYLINGYAPHVDIMIAAPGGGTDALVVEYAYNNSSASRAEDAGTEVYGSQTGAWYATFNDDTVGDSSVTSASNAWISSGAAGGVAAEGVVAYGDIGSQFIFGTLAEWVAGTEVTEINADTVVLELQFEVDSWIVDTTALIRAISVTISGQAVGLSATIADSEPELDIVAISVDTNALNFGNVYPGTLSDVATVVITNEGTVSVDVTPNVAGDTIFTSYLEISPSGTFSIATEGSQAVGTQLNIPETYVPRGAETGTLTFEVVATPS